MFGVARFGTVTCVIIRLDTIGLLRLLKIKTIGDLPAFPPCAPFSFLDTVVCERLLSLYRSCIASFETSACCGFSLLMKFVAVDV